MEILRAFGKNFPLKLLSLILAVALWFLASGSRDAERNISIPLCIRNVPSGLTVSNALPETVEITVAGPKMRLLGVQFDDPSLCLDLDGLREGTATFSGMEKRFRIPPGITVTRIYPSVIDVKLVPLPRSGRK